MIAIVKKKKKNSRFKRFFMKIVVFVNCLKTSFFPEEIEEIDPRSMIVEDYEDEQIIDIQIITIAPESRLMAFISRVNYSFLQFANECTKRRIR